jgi:hypothetical protein
MLKQTLRFLLGFFHIWRKKYAACSCLLPVWSACEILSCGSIALGVIDDGTMLSDGGDGGLRLACTSYYTCVPAAQHDSEELLFILCITSLEKVQRLKRMGKEVLSATLVFSSHGQTVPGTG